MEKIRSFTPSRLFFSLLAAAIMTAIFCLSGENADESSETSGFFTDFVLRHLIRGYDGFAPERQEEIHGLVSFIVRKTAHFSAYASLGACTSFAVGKRRVFSLGSLIAWGICIIYACSDEIHQHFVAGRSCELRDVMIDSCGALTGMLAAMAAAAVAAKAAARRTSAA